MRWMKKRRKQQLLLEKNNVGKLLLNVGYVSVLSEYARKRDEQVFPVTCYCSVGTKGPVNVVPQHKSYFLFREVIHANLDGSIRDV